MFRSNGSDSIAVQGSRIGVRCPPTRSLDPSESTMQTTSMVAQIPTTGLRCRTRSTATTSSSGIPR